MEEKLKILMSDAKSINEYFDRHPFLMHVLISSLMEANEQGIEEIDTRVETNLDELIYFSDSDEREQMKDQIRCFLRGMLRNYSSDDADEGICVSWIQEYWVKQDLTVGVNFSHVMAYYLINHWLDDWRE